MSRKIHSIGFQFADSTVKLFPDEPSVNLEVSSGRDRSPYRVRVNGLVIECETVAKLFINGKVYTCTDPYISPSYQDKGWQEEEIAWRKHLGSECFDKILNAMKTDMVDRLLDAEFPKDDEVQKKKRLLEKKIAKELHERRIEKRKREMEAAKKVAEAKVSAITTSNVSNGRTYPMGGLVKIDRAISIDKAVTTSAWITPQFTKEEVEALKESVKNKIK